MNSSPKLKLVSFNLCPFVQRSVILLNEKGVEFGLDYIDLENKPDWFLKISPLGKVPVLLVGETPIFESAVISEYLDETVAPALHPTDPLIKASHRAWIEFGSTLLMAQYRMQIADSEEKMNQERLTLLAGLDQLSRQCHDQGPFFAGSEMSLLDTAIAPLFMRADLMLTKCDLAQYPNARIERWAAALAQKETVKRSVVDDFSTLFFKRFQHMGGYMFLALM